MLSLIEEIKNRLDIVEVIGSYIKLQKSGINFRALCPFHSEKTPSFFVSPTRQIWHCFGCQKGGDIFGFIREIEGVEFGDALKLLAKRAGVELKKQDPRWQTAKQRLYEISEWACKFFEKQLESSQKGKEVKKYLKDRGIKEKTIKEWRLGYAPDNWQGLSDFLVGKGYKREEVMKAGLAIISDKRQATSDKKCYDRFRRRIMFPIFDLNNQVVGYGGRIFEATSNKQQATSIEAKYINTPNTLIYDKSRILYGLNKAKMEIRKQDQCILVEGYTDVIMSHQAGIKNVISTSGTTLTIFQLKILKRYSSNILTSFDMDIAGDSATKRGIDLAQSQDFNIRVAILPPETDPADCILKGLSIWEKAIKDAKSIIEYYFENAFSKYDKKTAQGKREISKIILPIIKRVSSKIEQCYWIRELAKKLEVREEDVWSDLQKVTTHHSLGERKVFPGDKGISQSDGGKKSRQEILEEKVISFLLKKPEFFLEIKNLKISFSTSLTSQIFREVKQFFLKKKPSEFNLEKFKSKLSPDLNYLIGYLELSDEIKKDSEFDDFKEFKLCLSQLQEINLRKKLNRMGLQIQNAEREKNKNLNSLIKKFNTLSQKLIKIKNLTSSEP